jgi:hypothetical protein
MASKQKKAAAEFLPPAERILAAKFLATSNLGQPEPRSADPAEVNRAWAECRMAHEAEGIDVTDEYRSWLRDVERGDAYCAEAWTELKARRGGD